MISDPEFAGRMRARYPEGLTGVVVVGGTRMGYAVEHYQDGGPPGRIEDMRAYGRETQDRWQAFVRAYFALGGHNLVMPILSYQLFDEERGRDYAEFAARSTLALMSEEWTAFYEATGVDPYFAGVDTLLRFPERDSAYRLGSACVRFQERWPYQDGRRKLIWEIAPIPLYSFWRAPQVMGDAEQARLAASVESAPTFDALYDALYRYYAQAVYGTVIPRPHFYLANNRNGDLKLRAMLPIALACGGPFRLFFTPYPTLLITPDTLRAILEDLAFGTGRGSTATDYEGRVTAGELAAEYERMLHLRADAGTTLGLRRRSTNAEE